ncbi:MAG: hypothetical protein QME51_02810, partial [Planctomycetota bacterium]|nr:hypothetical protein [Planctomycetota bacterium]
MPSYLVGIDEAGYGPQLGPLVVTAVVFEIPDALLVSNNPPCLWKKLSNIITVKKVGNHLLAVCDSKALYQPRVGIKEIEKTALTFMRLLNPEYSHYDGLTLPVSAEPSEITQLVQSLKEELAHHSLRFCDAKVRVVSPVEFNHGIQRHLNKADFLWEVSSELIRHCLEKYNSNNLLIIKAGKHGGRNYYASHLGKTFPDKTIIPIRQSFDISSYTINSTNSLSSVASACTDGALPPKASL